jgi:ferredoxin--NADP+ reductase
MAGRVHGSPRTFTAGWVKRGPSGVIGTNKRCANETAALLVADAASGVLENPGALAHEAVLSALGDRGTRIVDLGGWRAIDAQEREAGAAAERPRVKLTATDALLRAAGA